jgi:hypothetical protein
VALSIIVVEEHTWRTVELRNDNTLSSVDDEGSALGHERDLTEVNDVLFEGAKVTSAGLWVYIPKDELDGDTKWSCPRHSTVATLVLVVLRSSEVVRYKLKGCGIIVITNWEDRFEDLLKTYFFSLLWFYIGLKEPLVRALLNSYQIWDFGYFADLGVTITESEIGLDF